MLYRLKITKTRLNSCKNIYTCKHPETKHACGHNIHYIVKNFPYLIPAQNNFHDLNYVPAMNKL
jgi:hypothetical protein